MKKQLIGFTLVEMLLVMTVVAILASLAAPSFRDTLNSIYISNSVNTFMSDFRLARSQSMRRNIAVTMCRSNAPEAASPTCSNGSGIDVDGDKLPDGWASGWIIFEDSNGNGQIDADETIIRVQEKIKHIGSILEGKNPPISLPLHPLVGYAA